MKRELADCGVLPGNLMVSRCCWVVCNTIVIATIRAGASIAWSLVASFVVTVPFEYVLYVLSALHRPFEASAFAGYVAMSLKITLAFVTLGFWRGFVACRIAYAAPLATLSTTALAFLLCHFAVFGRRASAKSWVHS